jgi:hypothetical protein
LNSIFSEPEDGPLVQAASTERAIEIDRWLVPVKHRPFEPAAPPALRDLSKSHQQRFAVTFPAKLGANEEVL